uniref:Clathrin coat assembly protein AP180 n=1 Tax=Tetraodon nigroviridis TaxID=99883 RepID=H3CN38_TETNG
MSGQTLTDRIAAAQYSLTGSEVSRAVCKATTHEQTAPKKKHMEYLIQATQDQTNVNVPQMVDTLMERVGNASWVVVFKALITTHHLMVHGHEKFLQLLSSRNTLFNLSNFLDKTGSHGFDMSTFIRRYGRYLNEKSFAYRQMSFDFVRVKKGAEGAMRTMSVEKLLKGMPILQSQIDALLDFEVQPKDLNNGVINACFLLLFKDLIKLYACYNDGIINLLEKFFQMKRSQCKDGLEIYKRFLTRMTRVSDFFKIAEQMGIDKNDIPELTQAPESLLESLETHLNTLEGKKPSPTKLVGFGVENLLSHSKTRYFCSLPSQDATANNTSPAAGATTVAAASAPAAPPAKPPHSATSGGPPARPGPPAKPPPPSVTPTAPTPPVRATSNPCAAVLLLPSDELDPFSKINGSVHTATPAASGGAPDAPPTNGKSAEAAASAPATAVAAPPASLDALDAFAPSPGDGPSTVAAAPAADAFAGSALLPASPQDPFATTEGSGSIAPELDLFAMRPADPGAVTPPASTEEPTAEQSYASPAPAAPAPAPALVAASTPTEDTCLTSDMTESGAAPTLDIFGDMFDSMPAQSPTTESKAATTPSVDLFGAESYASPAPAAPAPAPALVAASTPTEDLSSPKAAEPANVIDLLADSFGGSVEEPLTSAPGAPGDDLLGGLMSPTLAPTAAAPPLAPAVAPVQNDLLEAGLDSVGPLPSPAAPVSPPSQVLDGLGDLLMPAVTPQSTGGSTTGSMAGSMGTPITPGVAAVPPATPPPTKTIGGVLDSALDNLIGDLGVKKKDPQSEKKLTGGANWTPQVAPTSWGTPAAPMAGSAPAAPGAPGFGMPPTVGPGASMMQPMMGQPMMGQPMMRPPFTGMAGAAPGAAAPGAPVSSGAASQSPKKPKDPLADLDLKDFL